MTGRDLAIHRARIHPMTRGAESLDGCVDVRDGRIAGVVTGACRCGADGTPVVAAAGRALLPGFVDGHRHTWQTAFRHTLAGVSIADYGGRMLGRLAPRFLPEDVYAGTLLGALTALDSGITTLVDWAHVMNTPDHADAAVDALLESGIRAQFGYGIPRDGTARWSKDSGLPHPRDVARIHERLGTGGRVRAVLAARGPEMSTDDVTAGDIRFARELGIRISMHVGAGDLGRLRAVRRLADAGLLGDDMTFIHLESTSDEELALIRDAGAGTCIGPATEILMPGVGWPVTLRLLRHGLEPALSVDTEVGGPGSMFDQMRAVLAGAVAEAHDGGGSPLEPGDALRMATSSGADAIGMPEAGRIEPGAVADLVLVDTAAVNLAPALRETDAIVLAGHPGNVDTVIVDGVVRKRDGRLVGADVAAAVDRARRSAERLVAEAGMP